MPRRKRGSDWTRHKLPRMSVRQAREWGEGAHLLMHLGSNPSQVRSEPPVIEALAVLWQQERALRAEVAKLQERLGIRPDKRVPAATEVGA